MKIDGIKYSSKDIEGIDLDAVKKFCQKNKVKAAHMVYVDTDGNIESCGVYFNSKANDILKEYFKRF